MSDELHYPTMINNAMRGLVRDVLRRIEKDGLPGEHHFYISFDTNFPGVEISDQLQERYPEEMTIVMQHQFWDFKVEQHQFTLALSFSGVPEKLVIPFDALTAFADPSVKFGLQFQLGEAFDEEFDEAELVELTEELMEIEQEANDSDRKPDEDVSAEVISLDAFRKK